MSHWLDDAARGLSEGRYSRRQVLKRGGVAAGGALLGSMTGPLGSLVVPAVATGAVICSGQRRPCKTGEQCCPGFDLEDICYDPSIDQCCVEDGVKKGICSRRKECCGHHCCEPDTQTCCGGGCADKVEELVCCRKNANDPGERCYEDVGEDGQAVEKCCHSTGTCYDPRDQVCCGSGLCDKRKEECCHSGSQSYCAPKGECCPKGEHRISCGDYETPSRDICCPEDEYCCGGVCCHPLDCGGDVCCFENEHRVTCADGKHICCPKDAACCGGVCCTPDDCQNGTCMTEPCSCPPPLECCGPQTATSGLCISPPPYGAGCCNDGVPSMVCGSTCCSPEVSECCGPIGAYYCCPT